jgi:hypothetical protein
MVGIVDKETFEGACRSRFPAENAPEAAVVANQREPRSGTGPAIRVVANDLDLLKQ